MKTASISFREVKGFGFRFDAPVHLSEGVSAKRLIQSCPYELLTIGDVSERVWHAGRWRRVYVNNPNNGITLLGSSAILKSDLSKEKMISVKYTEDKEDQALKKGWTLISCSGTIGNCAFANAQHAEKLASQDVIRVSPNNILREGVIYAFLASKYGYSLLTQGTFGSVIQHIEPENVKSIPIPHFPETFQKEVDGLMQESARLREEAVDALEEAKVEMSLFIGINHKSNKYKTDIVSSKAIWNSLQHRLDPPALMNDGVVTMNQVSSIFQHKTIGEINARVHRPGIFKRSYVENGLPYIKGSEIFLTNPFRRCEYLSKTRTPFVEEMSLSEGQILITCAGSVGNVKMITKEYEDKGAIGSQDIIRLISSDSLYSNEYLFTYLQMPFVFDYIQSMKYGSVIERIEPFHVESIPVVEPTIELSAKITSLIRQYMAKTYRAFKCEEQAIHMVEREIESWNK